MARGLTTEPAFTVVQAGCHAAPSVVLRTSEGRRIDSDDLCPKASLFAKGIFICK